MAEIEDWIKEQLKKGYKKEQIKEGLRKAGYQQDIIGSVDSLAKKKILCYFLYFIIFLVIILIFFVVKYFLQYQSNIITPPQALY